MAKFSTFIRSIYRDGNDGKQFERFVKWFLKNEPEWSTQVDQVWLWDEWPERWGIDKGIDLIFRHRNGEIWAVQAKCYSSDYYVTKADIDTFLTESNRKIISRRLLIASTDRIGENARETCAGQEKPVTRFMLSEFQKAEVDYPRDYKKLRSAKRKKRPKPHDYQEEAIQGVAKGFKTADRGQLIMACGTGKTYTTLWIKERLKSKCTLVLVPSLNLLAQTVREWTFASKSNLEVLCVCSDQSVGRRRDEDEVIQLVADSPFPVQNRPKEITKFLKGDGDKVVFSTYQSSPLIEEVHKNKRLAPFDLVIADEAHRCASAGKADSAFITILDNKKIKATRLLFATATPRVYSSSVKKAAEERGVEVFGMDDTSVFGKVFHTLSFGEAIKRKPPLLTDYQVIIVGVDDVMIAKWIENRELVATDSGGVETDAESLAAQIGLLKATRDYDLKRLITFHGRVKSAEYFAANLKGVRSIIKKRHLPKGTLTAKFVSGKMPTHERQEKLRSLRDSRSDQISILSNARCLSEGVDVPSLDGIAFIDPRSSDIDIIQAVGRAIRLSKSKSIGSIVIPVFIQEGDDANEAIEKSDFKKIWWVINALKAHDEALANELDGIRTEMGKHNRRSIKRGGLTKIVFDLPTTVNASFANALRTQLVEQTTGSWFFWFGLLTVYASVNGHANVPKLFSTMDGHKLGIWVNTQRSKRSLLPEELQCKLEALPGWVWHAKKAQWEEAFIYIQIYVREFGHASVPSDYKLNSGFQLGGWVVNQRSRRSILTKEQERRLEALQGWSWDTNIDAWNSAFSHLENFVAKYGHARVPYAYKLPDGFNLGSWVANQRSSVKKTSRQRLSDERKTRLERLPGWVWTVKEAFWVESFERLQHYLEEFGHAGVPADYITSAGFKLGAWAGRQRQRTKNKKLSNKEKKLLLALPGWVTDVQAARWEEGFEHLQSFAREFGHANVPDGYETASGFNLGDWVRYVRGKRKSTNTKRKKRLESLTGWVWSVNEADWDQRFQQVKVFADETGHARVPNEFKLPGGFNLGSWCEWQRRYYKRKTLASNRIKRLEQLPGWVWDPAVADWEHTFNKLVAYIQIHKTSQVPQRYNDEESDGFSLGPWVNTQRTRFKRKTLLPDQIKKLEGLPNWSWDPLTEKWDTAYNKLVAYTKRHKTSLVLQNYKDEDGFSLGAWVSHQRAHVRNGTISSAQIKKLQSLPGWTINRTTDFEEAAFGYLKAYYKEYGHCRVPKDYKTSDGFNLDNWVSGRRQSYKNKTIKPEQQIRLEKFPGWAWNPLEAQWENGFMALLAHVEEFGTARVNPSYRTKSGFKLGSWVSVHRLNRTKANPKRNERLEQLPSWTWDPVAADWEQAFKKLVAYTKSHKTSLVPQRYKDVDDFKLGSWVGTQRIRFKNGTLSSEEQKKLQALNKWAWTMVKN